MICWHEPGPFRMRCQKEHRADLHILYGRCRSGRCWFWCAKIFNYDLDYPNEYGWSDTEAQALEHVRDAVVRLAGDRSATADIVQHIASHRLKELNAEKRRSRPPSGAKGSRVTEYLYGRDRCGGDYNSVYRFRITKRTAKRIYYVSKAEWIDERGEPRADPYHLEEETIGFVDRQKLETEGSVRNLGRHWSSSDYRLYASLEGLLAQYRRDEPEKPDLASLKAAMAAAHPDKGGSSAAFIEARHRYVAARRAQRSGERETVFAAAD